MNDWAELDPALVAMSRAVFRKCKTSRTIARGRIIGSRRTMRAKLATLRPVDSGSRLIVEESYQNCDEFQDSCNKRG
jgi:hypothetical protein